MLILRLVAKLCLCILLLMTYSKPGDADDSREYAPYLAYVYKVVKPGDDSVMDYSDRIFAIVGGKLVLTNYRFSEVYADLLYSQKIIMERGPYFEEMAERRRAGEVISGTRLKIKKGISSIRDADQRQKLIELGRSCSNREYPNRNSQRIRIYDYVLDVSCLLRSDEAIAKNLLTYLRHSLIANDLEVHAARELFISQFDRASTSVVLARDILLRGNQSKLFAEHASKISVRSFSFDRPWYDGRLFSTYVSGRFGMYRNEFAFGPSRIADAPRNYCFAESLITICNKSEADEHCVIENITCRGIPDFLVDGKGLY